MILLRWAQQAQQAIMGACENCSGPPQGPWRWGVEHALWAGSRGLAKPHPHP